MTQDRKLYVLKASKDDTFLTSSPNYFGPLYDELLERSKIRRLCFYFETFQKRLDILVSLWYHLVMAKFFTTTHSTSLIAKRSSENRTYTHAVWVQMAHSTYINKLKREIKSYEELNASYRQKAEQGGTTTKWGHHTTPEQYLGYIHSNEEAIRNFQAKLDADTGVTPDPWTCQHWCGREDLAQKQASSWFNKGYHVEVTVVKERDKKLFAKVGK